MSDPGRSRGPRRTVALGPLVALAGSLVAFALAPTILDDSYSWVRHTSSEAAGQSVDGAWATRASFLLFGMAILWLAYAAAGRWRQPATALHVTFGGCLLAVSAFSARPWDHELPYDRAEDLLHSVGATVMGFAFAFGVVAVWWQARRTSSRRRSGLDVVAVAASVVVPIAMLVVDDVAGLLQRLMFAIAYLWYAREALR